MPSAGQVALVQSIATVPTWYFQNSWEYKFIFLVVWILKYPCPQSWVSIYRSELFCSALWLLFNEAGSDKTSLHTYLLWNQSSCHQLCLQGQGCVLWIFQKGIQTYLVIETQARQPKVRWMKASIDQFPNLSQIMAHITCCTEDIKL